ncbi:MAG: c-type cytochrome [Rhodospirillales bacterium]|nr:c-type cytochrome [Rhodospirillales bacterium]
MKRARFAACALAISVFGLAAAESATAADPTVERGKYLVTVGGCHACHTPGYFFGQVDMTRALGGSEVGFEVPAMGVFYGSNLTMDKATGLGDWSDAQIAAAMTTGRRPDGRKLAPVMPWQSLAALSRSDVSAIIAYLRSLPPVQNKVPGPFGPAAIPGSWVLKLVPPQAQSAAVGATLAERWCTRCHDIERTAQPRSAEGVPSFKAIVAKPQMTPAELDSHLSSTHTGMPDFQLSLYERSLLIAYIQSLR